MVAGSTGKKLRILLVEDNDELGDLVVDGLSTQFEVVWVRDADRVTELLKEKPVDVLITDLSLPGRSGFDLLAEVRKTDTKLKIIVTSGHLTSMAKRRAHDLKVHAYMEKPFKMEDLITEIQAAIG